MNEERKKIVRDLASSWDGEDLEHLIWEMRAAIKTSDPDDVNEAARQGFYGGDVGHEQMPSASDLADADDVE
jgi:hypothetical protein